MSDDGKSDDLARNNETEDMPDELHDRYRQLLDTKRSGSNQEHGIPKLTDRQEEKYQVGRRIAKGGMGEVRNVTDVNCQRNVAMKVLYGSDKKAPKRVHRFIREARITAQLEHPNIVPVYEVGVDADDNVFYTMKKVRGTTLETILGGLKQRNPAFTGTYSLSRLLTIFQGICHALAFAHSRGVIHRDLKPNNVMIGKYGEVVVMDWGLAKVLGHSSPLDTELIENGLDSASELEKGANEDVDMDSYQTMQGERMGTFGYMAPEQAEGRINDVDQRSDVFSLGVILYKILTLAHPTIGGAPADLPNMLKKGKVIAPADFYKKWTNDRIVLEHDIQITPPIHCPYQKVPASLSAVAMKALALDPSDRYQSVVDLQEEISRYQSGHATFAEDAGLVRLLILLVKRHKLFASGMIVFSLLTLAFVMGIIRSEKRAHSLAEEADRQRRLAVKSEMVATEASYNAQLRHANGLISQGDSHALLGQWSKAKSAYMESFQVFTTLNRPRFIPEYKLWETIRHSPPPVRRLGNPGSRRPLCVDISEDGTFYVAGYYDGIVILHNLVTPVEQHRYKDPQNSTLISAVAIADVSRLILAGRFDGTLDLWSITTGKKVRSLYGHQQMITASVFSPDESMALSASEDGKVMLWDIETGAIQGEFVGHTGGVKCLAFSSDAETVLSGGTDKLIAVWDRRSGREISTLEGHKHEIQTLDFSPDSRMILSGDYKGAVKVWDRTSGAAIRTFQHSESPILLSMFLNGGRSFVIGQEDSTITRWNLNHAPPDLVFSGYPNSAVDLSLSRTELCLIVGANGESIIQPLIQREVIPFLGHDGPIESVNFSSDAYLGVSSGWDKQVLVWDTETGNPLAALLGHKGTVTRAMFIPNRDSYTVVSGGHDGAIKIWNVATRTEIVTLNSAHGPVEDIDIDGGGDFALVGYRDSHVLLWDLKSGRLRTTFHGPDAPVVSVDISSSGQLALLGYANGRLILADLGAERNLREFAIPDLTLAVFSPHNRWILCGQRSGFITAIDVDRQYQQYQFTAHSDEVYDLSYHPAGRYFLSASRDKTVKLWDNASRTSFAVLQSHTAAVTSARFSPNGRNILSGSRDRTLRMWDLSRFLKYLAFKDKTIDAQETLAVNPNNGTSLAVLGEWYAFRGMWEWAIGTLSEARRNGAEVSALTLARCYWNNNRPKLAHSEFQLALANNEAPNTYLRLCLDVLETDD